MWPHLIPFTINAAALEKLKAAATVVMSVWASSPYVRSLLCIHARVTLVNPFTSVGHY
mgnify:CR=1 FL=1